jgi:hypothetical protein
VPKGKLGCLCYMPAGFPVVQYDETMSHHLPQSATVTHHCQYGTTRNVMTMLTYDASYEHVPCSLPAYLQHMEPIHHHCLSHTCSTIGGTHPSMIFSRLASFLSEKLNYCCLVLFGQIHNLLCHF